MPALITHDTFGTQAYEKLFDWIGGSRDEAEAFLLGNQGPDPLFYSACDIRLARVRTLGSIMHRQKPAETLTAFKRALRELEPSARNIGRAYALGFLCHYVLDSTVHPFVYAQQFALCDAGEPGLTRDDGSEVHAVIESELDELVLTVKRGCTVEQFNPATCILKASERVLDIVSALYVFVAKDVFGTDIPAHMFKTSVKLFRTVQGGLFYSPRGIKRDVLGRAERIVRKHSFLQAMSHQNRSLTASIFGNDERASWENPYTNAMSTDSFWDLYDTASTKALSAMLAFDAPSFDLAAAQLITQNVNFAGEPVVATIISVE